MPKIYAKASRVIVWLGKAADDSDQALELIRKAAEEQYAESTIDERNQHKILNLLKREWFQRIWVLQEVAAARQVLIKCGLMEIDGYAFCSGLSIMKLSYETCPDLQSLVRSVTYLIRAAIFRPKYERDEASRSGRFSLYIRPLSELIDMYHTRMASERHDKVYALLGMSSDNPIASGLSPKYQTPWGEFFRTLVNFSISDQVSVDTCDDDEVAIIKGKGCGLGKVSLVQRDITRDDTQSVAITWKSHFNIKGKQSYHFTCPALAGSIQEGDAVCFLQGASKPSIVRPRNAYSTIIMIAVPLTVDLQPPSIKWPELVNDILLVWDVSQSKPQDEGYYECLISNRKRLRCPRTEPKCQKHLEKATRLCDFGLFLDGLGRYSEAGNNLRNALEAYRTALSSMDNSHSIWREKDEEALRVMKHLHIEDLGAAIEAKDSDGRAALLWAAGRGHEDLMQLLLEKDADIEAKGIYDEGPLLWASKNGHEAVVQLLLEKGADIEAKDSVGGTPLSRAAENGHEAIVQLLLEKGADIEVKDNYGQTPLSRAAENGHEAVVQLLLEKGADIEAKDSNGGTPLSWAAESRHEGIVQLLQSYCAQSS